MSPTESLRLYSVADLLRQQITLLGAVDHGGDRKLLAADTGDHTLLAHQLPDLLGKLSQYAISALMARASFTL